MQNEESVRGILDWDYLNTGFDVIDGLDYRLDDMGRRTLDKSVNGIALDDGNTDDTSVLEYKQRTYLISPYQQVGKRYQSVVFCSDGFSTVESITGYLTILIRQDLQRIFIGFECAAITSESR